MAVSTLAELPLLSAEQVAELLNIPQRTVLQLAREERLPSVVIGRRVRFSRPAVEAAVEAAMREHRPL